MKKLLTTLAILSTLFVANAQQNLSQGGTGWATSTLGDLLVGTTSKLRYTRLPVGSAGQVLWSLNGSPAWVATSSLGITSSACGSVGSAGVLQFASSTAGCFNSDSHLFWSTTHLSITNDGTNPQSPQTGTLLHLWTNGANNARVTGDVYSNTSAQGFVFQGRRSRGTISVPSAPNADDTLALIGGTGYGLTGFPSASNGAFIIKAESSQFTDTSFPTYLAFFTAASGTVTSIEKARMTSEGFWGLATTSPKDRLQVLGNVTPSGDATWGLGSSTQRWLNLFSSNVYASSSVITSATSTNLFVTNASSTNLTVSSLFNVLGTSTLATTTISTSTITNLNSTAALFTRASSTSFGILGLTAGSVPFIATGGAVSQSNANFFYNSTLNALAIGSSTFLAGNLDGKLKVVAGASTTPIAAYCNSSDYCQISVTNASTTGTASESGFTVNNGSSTATGNFGWFGINGVNYNSSTTYSTGFKNDVSLLSMANDLYIANGTTSRKIHFVTGSTSPVTNTRMTIDGAGLIGIATTAPQFALTVASGTVSILEKTLATSTSMTVDWKNGNTQLIRISTSAVTIAFLNATTTVGTTLKLIVCNAPTGTAGAITWTHVYWPSATVPTQNTTANKCDVWSFLATNGTSTAVVFGNQSSGF